MIWNVTIVLLGWRTVLWWLLVLLLVLLLWVSLRRTITIEWLLLLRLWAVRCCLDRNNESAGIKLDGDGEGADDTRGTHRCSAAVSTCTGSVTVSVGAPRARLFEPLPSPTMLCLVTAVDFNHRIVQVLSNLVHTLQIDRLKQVAGHNDKNNANNDQKEWIQAHIDHAVEQPKGNKGEDANQYHAGTIDGRHSHAWRGCVLGRQALVEECLT